MSFPARCVITSYSIHYTKLYELVDDGLAVLALPFPDLFQKLLAAEVVAAEFFFGQEAAFDHGLRGDAGVVRITSYNVCYTKLLRAPRRWEIRRAPGESRRWPERKGA